MKCPYSKEELQIAIITLPDLTEELSAKIKLASSEVSFPKNKAELNEIVAKNNGITVLDLINSPNYALLTEMYKQALFDKVVASIHTHTGITLKQSWAILMYGINHPELTE